jgi:hypothetical protein
MLLMGNWNKIVEIRPMQRELIDRWAVWPGKHRLLGTIIAGV